MVTAIKSSCLTVVSYISFVSFLISDFKKPTCFAFIFDASSGYDKVQKKRCLFIRNILETFVKIRISSDQASR